MLFQCLISVFYSILKQIFSLATWTKIKCSWLIDKYAVKKGLMKKEVLNCDQSKILHIFPFFFLFLSSRMAFFIFQNYISEKFMIWHFAACVTSSSSFPLAFPNCLQNQQIVWKTINFWFLPICWLSWLSKFLIEIYSVFEFVDRKIRRIGVGRLYFSIGRLLVLCGKF